MTLLVIQFYDQVTSVKLKYKRGWRNIQIKGDTNENYSIVIA